MSSKSNSDEILQSNEDAILVLDSVVGDYDVGNGEDSDANNNDNNNSDDDASNRNINRNSSLLSPPPPHFEQQNNDPKRRSFIRRRFRSLLKSVLHYGIHNNNTRISTKSKNLVTRIIMNSTFEYIQYVLLPNKKKVWLF